MNTQANQFYKEPWFGIVLTVLFFPAGIYVMFKFGPWRKRTKTILSIVLSLICIVVWTIAGLAPASSNPGVGETWLSSGAQKTVTVKSSLSFSVDAKGHVRLKGHVNLPDKTKLHVTLTHANTVVGDNVTVSDETWKTAALTSDNQALAPATYKVHVTSLPWSQQSDSVVAKLGKGGKQLRGSETIKTHAGRAIDLRQSVTYEP